ncbi:MAG: hypothetical protein WA996_06570 [Candidatus Promineifilaceae bacterium]
MSRLIQGMRTQLDTASVTILAAPGRITAWRVVRPIIPWMFFGVLLAWGWRLDSLFTTIPAFGDNLEAIWGIDWWYTSLIESGHSPAYTDVVFHPEGWQASTQAYGPFVYLTSIPLTFLGGEAFSHNALVILLFALTFAGVYRLARSLGTSLLLATLAGLLSTFWGFRWLRLAGHWHILWGAAFLPWMAWSLEQSLKTAKRPKLWLVCAGALWALSIGGSLYFIFFGGLVIFGWILGQLLGRRISVRQALLNMLIVSLTAILISLPSLFWFWSGIQKYDTPLPDIFFLNTYGASLNSLPIPFIGSPWLGSLSSLIYRGPGDESGVANMGLATFIVVLSTLVLAWRNKRWRPLLIMLVVGIVLAIGPTLKWDGESVSSSLFRPINTMVWQLGHQLKPEVFPSDQPPPQFENAVPMPGLILAATVPFWEGARTVSRYMLVAGIGFFLLAVLGLKRLRPTWVQMLVAAILIIEIVPPPVKGVPYPPEPHTAFGWLAGQSLGDQGIIDLRALDSERLLLPISAETLFATGYHGQSTAAGVGSVWPAHGVFLREWLINNAQPFSKGEFISLLRGYRIRFLLLHMHGEDERMLLEAAKANKDLEFLDCYPPPEGLTPWPYPICVLEVLPPSPKTIDVHLDRGWSATEDWGVWAEGEKSRIRWVATIKKDHTLAIEAFPHCLEDLGQSLTLTSNERELAYHEWQGCESWQGSIVIPQEIVEIGWNDLSLEYGYAARPIDVTGGKNPDPRALSLGFSRIEVYP